MQLTPYGAWSTRPRGATKATHPIGSTKGVTLHWEGPHMGTFRHDQCAAKVRGIQAFHRDSRGWADIAYNAVVCPHGHVFEGRGPGVQSAANGDEPTNDDWYAVCYLGGEGDGFTDDGKAAFVDAVRWLRQTGAAGPLVNGHRDHKATACPGDQIYDWLLHYDWKAMDDDMDISDEQVQEIAERSARITVRTLLRADVFPNKPDDTTVRQALAAAVKAERAEREN